MELQEAINKCRDAGYHVEKIIGLDHCQPLAKNTIRREGVEGIINRVSFHCGLSDKEIHMMSRKRKIVEARQLSHYIARKHTNVSLADIGWEIGRKDHATVLNSTRKIQTLLDYDKPFCELHKEVITLYGLKNDKSKGEKV